MLRVRVSENDEVDIFAEKDAQELPSGRNTIEYCPLCAVLEEVEPPTPHVRGAAAGEIDEAML